MRKSLITGLCIAVVGLLALTAVMAGCGSSTTTTTAAPTTTVPPTTTTTGGTGTTGASGGAPAKITIPLTGDESVPPVQTSASGQAIIMIEASPTGFNISYEIDVTNLVDATAAHIHLGAKGANGPVIVSLFDGPQKSGSFTGVLAQGSITQADLTGPMQGKTFADLAAAVLGGQTYVNVHTVANPDGEIRGQIIIPTGGATTPTTTAGGTATTAAAAGGVTTTSGSGY